MPFSTVEAGRLGQVGGGLDAEPGDDDVRLERLSGSGRDEARTCGLDGLFRQHLDAVPAVLLRDEVGERRRQNACGDPVLREHHRHVTAVRRERGRDLRADEAAPDHDGARALAPQRPHGPVVVERAVVDDAVGAGDHARPAACGEQELVPGVRLARVVGRAMPTEVERDDAAPEPEVGARALRASPDLRLVGTGPEALRERRPRVRRMLFGADDDDRAVRVVLPDSLDGGVAGHAAADDQIARRVHVSRLPES